MNISDLSVGKTASIDLLIKEAQIKNTKAGKPYLFLVLTDGKEDIKAQDWDWGDKAPPEAGKPYSINGAVSEYMGNKQIKVSSLTESNLSVTEFAPQGNFSLADTKKTLRDLVDSIEHVELQKLVKSILNDNLDGWFDLPAANGIHHAYVAGLIHHTVNVAIKAAAISALTPESNNDLVKAGAILHDMGKLWTYQFNGALIEMSDEGQMLEHLVLGIREIEKYRTPENTKVMDLIQHIISSHHGERAYGSPTTPLFIEAVIVNYADGVDAKTQTIIEANEKTNDKMTDKIWIMENRRMFSQSYINELMGK